MSVESIAAVVGLFYIGLGVHRLAKSSRTVRVEQTTRERKEDVAR
jgi:hypothetical protein